MGTLIFKGIYIYRNYVDLWGKVVRSTRVLDSNPYQHHIYGGCYSCQGVSQQHTPYSRMKMVLKLNRVTGLRLTETDFDFDNILINVKYLWKTLWDGYGKLSKGNDAVIAIRTISIWKMNLSTDWRNEMILVNFHILFNFV